MDILKLEVSQFIEMIITLLIVMIILGILGTYMKSKVVSFEKLIALIKVIFYCILLFLSLWLNVGGTSQNPTISLQLASKLSIGQLLVVTISLFEVLSNLVIFFKQHPSDFYLSIYRYEEEKLKTNEELAKLTFKINKLEEMSMELKKDEK